MRQSFLLISTIIFMCSAVLAQGTIELPAKSRFVQLKLKTDGNRWKPVDIPDVKSRKVTLAPGEYEYVMTLRSAVGTVSGSLTVEDGSYLYIHRAVAPDGKKIASWASAARPRRRSMSTSCGSTW